MKDDKPFMVIRSWWGVMLFALLVIAFHDGFDWLLTRLSVVIK